jgi:hypothetical protein
MGNLRKRLSTARDDTTAEGTYAKIIAVSYRRWLKSFSTSVQAICMDLSFAP